MMTKSTDTAASETQDPHVAWFDEWRRQVALAVLSANDSPEEVAALEKRDTLAASIASPRASSAEGLAARLAYISEDLGYFITESVAAPLDGALRVATEGASQLATCQTEAGSPTAG